MYYKKNIKFQEIAIIDLGSNSFHMLIVRLIDGAIQVLCQMKRRIYLASGLNKNNQLSKESIEQGLSCLTLFAERLKSFNSENVTIVGTHTFREASNAEEFVRCASEVIPYPIEIISGNEEAQLIFMGVEHTQSVKGRKLVIDIGGGSTELIIGENFKPHLIKSCCIGCINFGDIFFSKESISSKEFNLARKEAFKKFDKLALQYRLYGWKYAIGTSGTIKATCNALLAIGEKKKIITRGNLNNLISEILKHRSINTLPLLGISEERKSLFVPGLAILSGIFDALDIHELYFSEGALREGLLYEKKYHFQHQDIRSRTVKSLTKHYVIDTEQADRVLKTIEQLYFQWLSQNLKHSNSYLAILLKWAVLLHEVGLTINHIAMQKHSAYILQYSNLPGFNQEEQIILANLVRFHRKAIKEDEIPYSPFFKKKQFIAIMFLFRLASLLNNQRQSTKQMRFLILNTDDRHWTLTFPRDFLSQNTLVNLDLKREQKYWKDVKGWKLILKEKEDDI